MSETITGYLEATTQRDNKVTYELKRDAGRNYADWYIGYFEGPDRDGHERPPAVQLTAHEWYTFTVDVVKKGDKTYHNFVSVQPAQATQAPTQSHPQAAGAPARGQGATIAGSTDYRPPVDATEAFRSASVHDSISLQMATSLIVARIDALKEKLTEEDVLAVSERYDRDWFLREKQTQEPEATPEPPKAAAKAPFAAAAEEPFDEPPGPDDEEVF